MRRLFILPLQTTPAKSSDGSGICAARAQQGLDGLPDTSSTPYRNGRDRPIEPVAMPEACKVLISSRRLSSPLLERGELHGDVLTFGESEPLCALETITARHPEMIVLDHLFASTEKGLAFIRRIHEDPSLAGSAVLIVLDDGTLSRYTTAHPDRRAPRVPMRPGHLVQIDGLDAELVDLSLLGAQVVSGSVLRPGKLVRLVMNDGTDQIRVSAEIAWARYEFEATARYRAGLTFRQADPAAILHYTDRHRAEIPPAASEAA